MTSSSSQVNGSVPKVDERRRGAVEPALPAVDVIVRLIGVPLGSTTTPSGASDDRPARTGCSGYRRVDDLARPTDSDSALRPVRDLDVDRLPERAVKAAAARPTLKIG